MMTWKESLFLFGLLGCCNALYFHIGETERKCFIEELPDDTMVVGNITFPSAKELHPAMVIYHVKPPDESLDYVLKLRCKDLIRCPWSSSQEALLMPGSIGLPELLIS